MADRLPVQRRGSTSGSCRIDLSSEANTQLAVALGVVERLDAEPVAGQQQLAAARVPHREGEHAAQALDGAGAEVLVEVDDRFGVARGAERVAAPLRAPGAAAR